MPATNTATVQTATKIRATSIAITRAEGPTRLCRTRVFKTWKNASAALLAAAHTYPTSGYDKHDLVVTFADGETYKGRLDCQADGSDCNPATHIREYVEFLAGAARPSHMSEKQYSDFLRSDPARVGEAMAFLATYELAD